jgi:hypothetical protein
MNIYDDIRPYVDAEIPSAMKRITESEVFPLLASWIFPEHELEEVRRLMLSFKTIREFQHQVMMPVKSKSSTAVSPASHSVVSNSLIPTPPSFCL